MPIQLNRHRHSATAGRRAAITVAGMVGTRVPFNPVNRIPEEDQTPKNYTVTDNINVIELQWSILAPEEYNIQHTFGMKS